MSWERDEQGPDISSGCLDVWSGCLEEQDISSVPGISRRVDEQDPGTWVFIMTPVSDTSETLVRH